MIIDHAKLGASFLEALIININESSCFQSGFLFSILLQTFSNPARERLLSLLVDGDTSSRWRGEIIKAAKHIIVTLKI